MKNKIAVGLFLIFAVGAGYILYSGRPVKQMTSDNVPTTKVPLTGNSFSLADIAPHNSAASCWSVVNGSVYDLTTWINRHPGGPEAIVAMCGTDGSNLYNGQHGNSGRPKAALILLKIGELK